MNSQAGNKSQRAAKLLSFVTGFYGGGTEGQVLKLTSLLDKSRFAQQFGCLHKCGALLTQYEALAVPITEFTISSFYSPYTLIQQARFASHLGREKTDIMHSYNFYSNVFAIPAARLAGVPVIVASIRDRGVYLTPMQMRIQKWACLLADRILVNAESIREWLLEQDYPAHKIVVIRNGIDMSLYDRSTQPSAVRTALGIPESVPLVLLMARVNKLKGVEDFIRAAAIVNGTYPDARFLIVGGKLEYAAGIYSEDTAYMTSLQQLAATLGISDRVIFTGHRSDTAAILASVDVSVLPSYSEGLSNTLLESMAAGLPIVATDVGGNPELITHGTNGLLVKPKAPDALAVAIMKIVGSPSLAREFGDQARRVALENFSIEKMKADTQELYHAMQADKIQC